ncbi:Ubiquitin-protein ligase [Cichlidogyrus casuarinus]|uniref:E3 ubiquitin-protein ligase n=1 Tax=Cichlidogyrus casuarinus TaxID=1844966 RepID=A0ABD2QD93_9PLAT
MNSPANCDLNMLKNKKLSPTSGPSSFLDSFRSGMKSVRSPRITKLALPPCSIMSDFLSHAGALPHEVAHAHNEAILPESCIKRDSNSYSLLVLLRILNALNSYWFSVDGFLDLRPITASSDFHSQKLTTKANRQLADVFCLLAGNLPPWLVQLTRTCPFLFTFEVRQCFFYAHNFDRDRLLARLHETIGTAETETNQSRASVMSPASVLQAAITGPHSAMFGPLALSTASSSQQLQSLSALLAGSSSAAAGQSTHVKRHKVTIDRVKKKLLRQAENTLNELRDSRCILEIAFQGEVGFGIGPTLEFYTIVSRELMSTQLGLWHGSEKTAEGYLIPPAVGLFPRPLARNARSSQVKELRAKFHFIGRLMARALLDSRHLDLPLSPAFFKWLLSKDAGCARQRLLPGDLALLDPQLGTQFAHLALLANERAALCKRLDEAQSQARVLAVEANSAATTAQKEASYAQTSMKTLDAQVEELCLVWQLPGYPIDLIKGGATSLVNGANLGQYCAAVCAHFLIEGVQKQMQALIEGFDAVLPEAREQLRSMFSPEECEGLFCGRSGAGSLESWDVKTLVETCKCDHGYTVQSRAIRFLFDVMAEFGPEERRLFLQFVTGSPRLPVGGFRALKPPLKIVMKHEANGDVDSHLPSVMTCQNYLKLPNYSSKENMRVKLVYAIREGQNAFHLS